MSSPRRGGRSDDDDWLVLAGPEDDDLPDARTRSAAHPTDPGCAASSHATAAIAGPAEGGYRVDSVRG